MAIEGFEVIVGRKKQEAAGNAHGNPHDAAIELHCKTLQGHGTHPSDEQAARRATLCAPQPGLAWSVVIESARLES